MSMIWLLNPPVSVIIRPCCAVSFQFHFALVCTAKDINQHETNYRQNEAREQFDYDCVNPEIDSEKEIIHESN